MNDDIIIPAIAVFVQQLYVVSDAGTERPILRPNVQTYLNSDSLIRQMVAQIRRGGLAGDRGHRLALSVLHLGEEGSGHRQGGEVRGHPRCDPTVHTQLDRQVHGPEQPRASVAGDLSGFTP